MGNSEVGHLNLGAGAVVKQDLTRIDEAVADGTLAENDVLRDAVSGAERVHLIGLVSDGGVHSGWSHLQALIALAADAAPDLVVHAFTDGRDTLPDSGAGFLEQVQRWCGEAGSARVGSVVGRYWAMDRDKRWDRTQKAYDLLVHGRAEHHADSGARRSAPPTSAARPTSSSSPPPSATRRASAPATRSSPSTSAPTACARSPVRWPSGASTSSIAAGSPRSSATRR